MAQKLFQQMGGIKEVFLEYNPVLLAKALLITAGTVLCS